jgi:ATP-dependent Lhr-like helicase
LDTKPDLRKLMPHTYYAFLARFPQATPIQQAAAGPIMEGKPVLLCSPTASGKTEAYAAPLLQRYYAALRKGLARVLIISPTRALVNDLSRRLEAPMTRCQLELERRTGDFTTVLEDHRAEVVVTTPESLDSMLCRHPAWLGMVSAVVLDELHVVADSPRGTQLACLLERLDRVVTASGNAKPQRVAASATASWAEQLAEQYLGPEAVIIRQGQSRTLEAEYAPLALPGDLIKALPPRARKVLAFLPGRADTESYAGLLNGLPPFHRNVFVHHASLSRPERQRVEKAYLQAPSALVLATPTLEVGVDVGDVDLVALVGTPPDVSSLLQRAGRGNRRSAVARVLCLYRSEGEKLRFEHLVARAQEGKLLEPPPELYGSVLVQQSFSLVYQNRKRVLQAGAFWQRLPTQLQRRYSEDKVGELLAHLAERGWLRSSMGDTYSPTDKLENLFQRGLFHGNLDETKASDEVEVVEAETGRSLGKVRREQDGSVPESVNLGGRVRNLRSSVKDGQIRAETGTGQAESRFSRGSAPPLSRTMCEDLAVFLNLHDNEVRQWPIAAVADRWYLGHFGGTRWGKLLKNLVRRDSAGKKASKIHANPFILELQGGFVECQRWDLPRLRDLLESAPVQLAGAVGCGPWSRELPTDWLERELEEVLQLADFAKLIASAEPSAEKLEVLRLFSSAKGKE